MRTGEEKNKIAYFSRLAKYLEDAELSFATVKDVVLHHLSKLNLRFEQYFLEEAMLKESVGWVLNPFRCSLQNLPEKPHGLAEQLLELQADRTAQAEDIYNETLRQLIVTLYLINIEIGPAATADDQPPTMYFKIKTHKASLSTKPSSQPEIHQL